MSWEDLRTENELYKVLYERYMGEGPVKLDENAWNGLSDKTRARFRRIVDGINLSLDYEPDPHLQRCPNGEETRMQIMYALGFRPTEAGNICKNINTYLSSERSDVRIRDAFSTGGTGNTVGRISLDDAVYISPLLETPCSVLVSEKSPRHAPRQEAAWFRHLPSIDPSEIQLPWNYPSSSREKRAESRARRTRMRRGRKLLVRGMHCGPYFMEDLRLTVGLHILYLPDYVQVSIHVDEAVDLARTRWVERLVAIGEDIGIVGPFVYSVATQFLSQGATQIHRVSWLLNGGVNLKTRLRLFTRIFSQRTTEVSMANEHKYLTFSYPLSRRHEIIPELRRMEIFP